MKEKRTFFLYFARKSCIIRKKTLPLHAKCMHVCSCDARARVEKMGVLASDNIDNTIVSFHSGDATDYTITFPSVDGVQYAVRDIMTGVVTLINDGAQYSFTQAANTTIDARFEVMRTANAPTSAETLKSDAAPVVQKVFSNGTLYIVRDVEWFTADGARVK